VSSGGTTGIATITQMDPINVEFAVPQDRVPAVLDAQRAGQLPVTALDRARSQSVGEGVFSTLDNVIDTTTGTVRAKARFSNTEGRLFPNQFVNVRLQLTNVSGMLVPVTSVRTGPQGDYVYVIDAEDVAHTRLVTRGLATVDQILIAKGLEAGERVVTEGGDRVKDGARVQLQGQAPAAGASAARNPQWRASGPRRGASGPGWGASRPAAAAPAPGGGAAVQQPDSGARPAQSATENAAGSGAGAGGARAGAAVGSAGAAPSAAVGGSSDGAAAQAGPGGQPGTSGRGPNGRGAWLDSLPPAERDKIMAMSPDERRAYMQQMRARRQSGEGGPAN
jgi:multidrug efflux system membrane fusion protein